MLNAREQVWLASFPRARKYTVRYERMLVPAYFTSWGAALLFAQHCTARGRWATLAQA